MPGRETDHSKLDTERRRFLKGTGAGALAIGLAGCTGGEEEPDDTPEPVETDEETPEPVDDETEIPDGGGIDVGLPQPPEGMNVLSTNSAYSNAVLGHFHAGGVTLDPVTNEVRPWVYTDWAIDEVESGEPVVYFNVRDDLTFNDGTDLTVDDVIFTYEYLLEQNPGKYSASLDSIVSVEPASGDWDVRLQMDEVIGTWDSTVLSFPILPEHVWEDIDEFTERTPGIDGEVIGAGWADSLESFDADTSARVTLRKTPLTEQEWVQEHPNLHAGGPFLDEIRYLFYQSEPVLNQDLFAGDIDTYFGNIATSELDRAEESDRIRLVSGDDSGIGYFAYNLRRTPFDDITFRQALSFLWDEIYWTDRLNRGQAIDGDFFIPPGYQIIRPETEVGAEILEDPAANAFVFRESTPGVPDYEAIKDFMRNGDAITGEAGEFLGMDYPGSLTGVESSHPGGMHDYTWGEPQSDILIEEGVSEELYVNGQTIPEILGGPITYLMYPPETLPALTQADEVFSQNMIQMGIPVRREVQTFNALLGRLFVDHDFDLYHLGWGNLSPFGISSIFAIFHGQWAQEEGTETDSNNAMGYGMFDYAGDDDRIDEAREETDVDRRNQLVRQITEKIYLDHPYMVYQYSVINWPVNDQDFSGFIGGITDPGGSANWITQFMNIHQSE